jgi:hypothetical protein
LILVLLYGCGALLIREVTLRTGRGWPTILLLGAAYGVIEAGIVDQAMFNPSFEGWEFQAITPVPPLGISAWYAWTFVVGHSVWSIAVPIALVELLFPARARTPWLGRVGLVLTAAGYVAGCVVIGRFVNGSERFLASPSQLAGAAAVGLGLVALAFACRPVTRPVGNGWVPRPPHLGLNLFLALGVYQVRPESWAGLLFGIAWLALLAGLMFWFARQRSWGPPHQLALVAAALGTYAWLGFVLTSLVEPGDPVRWAGNLVFTAVALTLVIAAGRRIRAVTEKPLSQGSFAPLWGCCNLGRVGPVLGAVGGGEFDHGEGLPAGGSGSAVLVAAGYA